MRFFILTLCTFSLVGCLAKPSTSNTSTLSLTDEKLSNLIEGYSDLNEIQKELLKNSAIYWDICVVSDSIQDEPTENDCISIQEDNDSILSPEAIDLTNSELVIKTTELFNNSYLFLRFVGLDLTKEDHKEVLLKGFTKLENLATVNKIVVNELILYKTEFFTSLEKKTNDSSSQCPPSYELKTSSFLNYCMGADDNKLLSFVLPCKDDSGKDYKDDPSVIHAQITNLSKCSDGMCTPLSSISEVHSLNTLMDSVTVVFTTKEGSSLFCTMGSH